jgi:hypothetical protein
MDLGCRLKYLEVCVTAEEKLLLNATNKHQQVLSLERSGRISLNNEQGFRRQQRELACDSCESQLRLSTCYFRTHIVFGPAFPEDATALPWRLGRWDISAGHKLMHAQLIAARRKRVNARTVQYTRM